MNTELERLKAKYLRYMKILQNEDHRLKRVLQITADGKAKYWDDLRTKRHNNLRSPHIHREWMLETHKKTRGVLKYKQTRFISGQSSQIRPKIDIK